MDLVADATVPLEPARLARHRARLLRAAYAMAGSRDDAEDLVQETFERVLRRPRFVQRDNDVAYLLRVLRNTWGAQAKSAANRRTNPAPPEDLEWITDQRAGPEEAMDAQLAYAAMAELSDQQATKSSSSGWPTAASRAAAASVPRPAHARSRTPPG